MKKNRFINFASLLDKISNKQRMPFTSSEERDEFNMLEFFWNQCQPQDSANSDIWLKTLRKMEAEKSVSSTTPSQKRFRIGLNSGRSIVAAVATTAAVIALLIGVTLFLQQEEPINVKEIAIAFEKMNENTDDSLAEVTLMVSDHQQMELRSDAEVVYSSQGDISVDSKEVITDEVIAYNQIIVPTGKRSQITLSDNSKVWINSGTRVMYPRHFEGDKREIFVEGEVYLEVTHDEDRPFIVNTSGFEVRVLGTSFNVSAYRQRNQSSVVLVNGSVEIKDSQAQVLKIKPNERAVIDKASISGKQAVDVQNHISWIKGLFLFHGETLDKVLRKLSDHYGVDIVCDPSVANEQVYGKLELKEHLLSVLKSIQEIMPIAIEEMDQKIIITRD